MEGLPRLRRQLSIRAAGLLADELTNSVNGLEGTRALGAIAWQLRSFARRHPGLYASFLPAPTPEGDPEAAAALAEPVRDVAEVLARMGVPPRRSPSSVP